MAVGKYEDVEYAAIYCHNSSTAMGTKMAEYSSKEKVQKVMEMLREQYKKYVGASVNIYGCFQFPNNDEIEVQNEA